MLVPRVSVPQYSPPRLSSTMSRPARQSGVQENVGVIPGLTVSVTGPLHSSTGGGSGGPVVAHSSQLGSESVLTTMKPMNARAKYRSRRWLPARAHQGIGLPASVFTHCRFLCTLEPPGILHLHREFAGNELPTRGLVQFL